MPTPYSKSKALSFGATAASTSLTGKASQVILTATQACYVDFNVTATTTSSMFVPANTQVTIDLYGPVFMSAIRSASDGILTVTELGNVVLILKVFRKFFSSCNLKKTKTLTFKGDSYLLRRHTESSVTGDSSLKIVVAGSITGDSALDV